MDLSKEIDELPKEQLIMKCKRFLLLAQKAKQAKQEYAEELKKSEENEKRLSEEIATIQELVAKKENDITENKLEIQNLISQNVELNRLVENLKASSIDEVNKNLAFEKTLNNLNAKISEFEIRTSEDKETISNLKKSLNLENEQWELKYQELLSRFKMSEEKYALVDKTLVEFQEKYLLEKNKHAKLASCLEKKLEEKSEKSSVQSDTRDGLQTIFEAQEFETVCQKMDNSGPCEHLKVLNDVMNQMETIKKERSDVYDENMRLQKLHSNMIEKCLQRCQELDKCCKVVAEDYHVLDGQRVSKSEAELTHLSEQGLESNRLTAEVHSLKNDLTASQRKLMETEKLHADDVAKLIQQEEEIKALKTALEKVKQECQLSNINEVGKYQNDIEALNRQLKYLQEENALADNKFSELQATLAESNRVSESLEIMVNQRYKEYDAFEQKVKAYDLLLPQLQVLWKDVKNAKKDLSALKSGVVEDLTSLQLSQSEDGSNIGRIVENFASKIVESNSELLSELNKVKSQGAVDGESNLEEYNKLNTHVIGLERKNLELENQISKERETLLTERADFQANLATLQAQLSKFSTLQADYDELQAKTAAELRDATDLQKSLNTTREDNVLLRQTVNELEAEQSKFKQEKATFDMIKKELTSQIQSLKKTIEKQQGKSRDWEREKERWEAELSAMGKKLQEEKDKQKAMAASLEEERHKQKKQSVLSLEMADYERTVTEMRRKLDAKESQIKELLASLSTQREINETFEATVTGLEMRVKEEQANADAAKQRQDALQEELSALRSELTNKAVSLAEAERLSQERSLELDALLIEVSTAAAELTKSQEKCRAVQDAARIEICTIDEKRTQLQASLSHKELELEELRKDFESYKVRAQSVLRQSQRDGPPGRQQDIEEEVIQLRATCDSMRIKLEDAARRLQQVSEELSVVTEEKNRLSVKVHKLQAEAVELNTANAELQAAEQKARELNEEAARLLPVQQETLAQCYRREREELEAKYLAEIETLRNAHQQAETALQLHLGRHSTPTHRRQHSASNLDPVQRRQTSSGFVPVKTEREPLDVLMLEREACEGSESVDSSSPRVLPLEQLLSPQPQHATSIEASQWADKLEKCESRIQHLTSLLSDAESDAARLQQLNQVLKDEIRRKERNVAREEHAGNLEYLKNVVVKFGTLPRGDERLRLVPVLNTILKLSREEEQRLCAAARGDGVAGGWGSYLGGMLSGTQ